MCDANNKLPAIEDVVVVERTRCSAIDLHSSPHTFRVGGTTEQRFNCVLTVNY
jgi:hypothetical protein